jgi:hypothetical protein
MTTKDDLHQLVDALDEAATDELLEYAQWLLEPMDTLTHEERARVEAGKAAGEFTTLEEVRRKLGLRASRSVLPDPPNAMWNDCRGTHSAASWSGWRSSPTCRGQRYWSARLKTV